MFDEDLTTLPTTDLLESAADYRAAENRAATRLIEHAQIYADRHHPDACPIRPGRRSWEGRERSVVLGGDGCPEIAEFAVTEFGVILGMSPGVAADYLGQALALRHRFPFTWARVLAGEATPWRARLLTTACLKLSEQAAHYVDQRVAPILDTVTPYRLEKIIKAAKIHADPEGARAEADEKARERGVFIGRTNEHGTQTIYIRTTPGAATRFDATIAAIADAQQTFGDNRTTDHRRAHAVGIIADPRFADELLLQAREQHLHTTTPKHTEPAPTTSQPSTDTAPDPGDTLTPDAQRALDARLAQIKHEAHTNPTTRGGADRPGGRLRPGKTEIYVHLTDHTLATGTGVLRAESIGPLLATQLTELIGHGPYTVKPVIDLNDAISVDAYEIPHRIRERIKLTHPVELFPYGTRETTHTIDIDHIQPYDPLAPPGQTNTTNLAPLGRFTHRVKTHAHGWNVHRLDYRTLEWTTPHKFTFHVTPTGTHRVPRPSRTADPL